MKDDINHALQELGRAFDSGAGPIPLERLVALHLGALQNFRARGLTWDQISRLLVRAGVVRPDGRPFGAAHLRGIYARQLKRRRPAGPACDQSRTLDPGDAGGGAKPMVSQSSNTFSKSDEVARIKRHDGRSGAYLAAGGSNEGKTRRSEVDGSDSGALRNALRRAASARKTQR